MVFDYHSPSHSRAINFHSFPFTFTILWPIPIPMGFPICSFFFSFPFPTGKPEINKKVWLILGSRHMYCCILCREWNAVTQTSQYISVSLYQKVISGLISTYLCFIISFCYTSRWESIPMGMWHIPILVVLRGSHGDSHSNSRVHLKFYVGHLMTVRANRSVSSAIMSIMVSRPSLRLFCKVYVLCFDTSYTRFSCAQ